MSEIPHKSRRKIAETTRALLVDRFPNCFFPKGASTKRPLKIGIGAEIAVRCPDICATDLDIALESYASRPSYLAALTFGAMRVDLDGNETSPVDRAAARNAARRLGFIRRDMQREAEVKRAKQAVSDYDAMMYPFGDGPPEWRAVLDAFGLRRTTPSSIATLTTTVGEPNGSYTDFSGALHQNTAVTLSGAA